MLINEKHLAELNSPIQKINARVELHSGSTLEAICTCNDYLSNFTIERVGEGKFFGYGICHKLNITFIDPNRDLNLTNIDSIEVTFGVNGEFIYPFPIFYITSEIDRNETTNEISLTAYDALYQAVNHKTSELSFLFQQEAYTLKTFTAACATVLGMPLKIIGVDDGVFDTVITSANFDGTESIRDALNAVAEATQTIYYMSGDWELTFKRLDKTGNPVLTIDKAKYIDLKSGVNNTLTGIEFLTELGNNVAAGLKMTASGDTVKFDEISDINNHLKVKVSSKNIFDSSKSLVGDLTNIATWAGVVFEVNTVKSMFKPNTQYTAQFVAECLENISYSTVFDGHIGFVLHDPNDRKTVTIASANVGKTGKILTLGETISVSNTFTTPADLYEEDYKLLVYTQRCLLADGTTPVLNKLKFTNIQIEEGTTKTSYSPFAGDLTQVTVTRCGKNLAPSLPVGTVVENNGVTFTAVENGGIAVSGTPTAVAVVEMASMKPIVKTGKIAVSLSGEFSNIVPDFKVLDSTGKMLLQVQTASKTVVNLDDYPTAATWIVAIKRLANNVPVSGTVYTQIELGDTFTEYEPYQAETYQATASGVIEGISAISPTTVLYTNTPGVAINAECYRKQSNGSTQYIRNNPFYELRNDIATLADNALAAAYGLTINPFECNWLGNYLVEIGDKIALTAENDNEIITYMVDDSISFDGTLGQYSKWEYIQDEAETASTPSSLGEVINQTIATVDKVNREITLRVTYEEMDSAIKVSADNISAEVKKETEELKNQTEDLKSEISAVKIEASNFKLEADNALLEFKTEITENGVTKVSTSTGYSFDSDGLNISRSDSDINTTINHNGMRVDKDGVETLTANNAGVNAYNLTATTYLTIGTSSRFENYEKEGVIRTACFWIGG